MEARKFNIIVWYKEEELVRLVLLSWVLNQDLAGAQKEKSFLKQLEHARLKWIDMGKPQPTQ